MGSNSISVQVKGMNHLNIYRIVIIFLPIFVDEFLELLLCKINVLDFYDKCWILYKIFFKGRKTRTYFLNIRSPDPNGFEYLAFYALIKVKRYTI